MVSSKENTERMKTKVLAYWRYNKHFPYVSTEAGPYNADILIAKDESHIIEIEVKNSWQDFLHDFKKKIYRNYKHEVYQKGLGDFSPHEFYFAVPKCLVSKVSNYVKDNQLPYGVIGVLRGKPRSFDKKEWVRVFLKSKKLHSMLRPRLYRSLCLRESSEVVTLRQKMHNL